MEAALKPERWLRLSLLLNLVLLLAAGWMFTPSHPNPDVRSEGAATPKPFGVGTGLAAGTGPVATRPDAKGEEWNWSQLDVMHWPAYRDGLRAIGCPESRVHEILDPLVYRQFAAQAHDAAMPFSLRFWETILGTGSLSKDAFEKASQKIEAAYRAALETVFSSAAPGNPDPDEGSVGNQVDDTVRLNQLVRSTPA